MYFINYNTFKQNIIFEHAKIYCDIEDIFQLNTNIFHTQSHDRTARNTYCGVDRNKFYTTHRLGRFQVEAATGTMSTMSMSTAMFL